MDMAVEGANNARLATQNVLDVTAFARQTASVAGPQLEHVANTTKDLVTDLRSLSFPPEPADRTRWVGSRRRVFVYPKKGGKWSTSCGPCCC